MLFVNQLSPRLDCITCIFILYFKVSLEDGHLGQATPHNILYVHCKLLHLNSLNVICREINFD